MSKAQTMRMALLGVVVFCAVVWGLFLTGQYMALTVLCLSVLFALVAWVKWGK